MPHTLLTTLAANVPSAAMPGSAFLRKPHRDGREWDCQCARCGSSLDWIQCSWCGGDGTTASGELYEEDPMWYDPDDVLPCHQCGGEASWPVCLSGDEWCNAHPMAGREYVESGTAEWWAMPSDKLCEPAPEDVQ